MKTDYAFDYFRTTITNGNGTYIPQIERYRGR
jgi:hypothetical protein